MSISYGKSLIWNPKKEVEVPRLYKGGVRPRNVSVPPKFEILGAGSSALVLKKGNKTYRFLTSKKALNGFDKTHSRGKEALAVLDDFGAKNSHQDKSNFVLWRQKKQDEEWTLFKKSTLLKKLEAEADASVGEYSPVIRTNTQFAGTRMAGISHLFRLTSASHCVLFTQRVTSLFEFLEDSTDSFRQCDASLNNAVFSGKQRGSNKTGFTWIDLDRTQTFEDNKELVTPVPGAGHNECPCAIWNLFQSREGEEKNMISLKECNKHYAAFMTAAMLLSWSSNARSINGRNTIKKEIYFHWQNGPKKGLTIRKANSYPEFMQEALSTEAKLRLQVMQNRWDLHEGVAAALVAQAIFEELGFYNLSDKRPRLKPMNRDRMSKILRDVVRKLPAMRR
eukprot:GHVP01047695.1.p1 GENE.GHVP01047695.1~~GHVP01047695.1.p1  ORF type:complete len:453 (+),score=68.49 GHVP01047695.1:183-1361(+)